MKSGVAGQMFMMTKGDLLGHLTWETRVRMCKQRPEAISGSVTSMRGWYGGGIGAHGVVCFDSVGRPIFKYSEFAEQNQLPFIDDCYAMNVVDDDEMWLSYYSDFPLISVKNFQLAHRFNEFGCMSRAFAILGESAVFPKCYTPSEEQSQLLRRQFSDTGQSEKLEAVDETGTPIGGKFTAAARGSHFYLFNKTALYKLTTDL